MLVAQMYVLFFNSLNAASGYSADLVTSVTFKFDENVYYIGFFEPVDEITEYQFDEKYLVNIKFPSIDCDFIKQYDHKWKDNPILEIVMGKKVIGTGELKNWEFKPT